MQKSKILSQKTVYNSKYFRVEKREEENDEKIVSKDYVVRDPIVMIIPLTTDNQIYLARQYRGALDKISTELFAGHLDAREDPLDGAKRELKEESGLTAGTWKHLAQFHISANMEATVDIFVAEDLIEGASEQEADEDIEMIKISFAEAIEKIENGEIDAASHVAALLLLDKLRKEGKI